MQVALPRAPVGHTQPPVTPQVVIPATQTATHTPEEHTCPAAHERPPEPQLARSVLVLTSQPLLTLLSQLPYPVAHAANEHTPSKHAAVALA